MLVQIVTENGQKKVIPLTADAGAGAPVGTVIVVCSNQIPSNYLPLGTQYDTSLYPVLYALLGTDTTPTASALGLPTLTSGQYAIKATSGLTENQQENVLNTINENNSYSTEEHPTGKKYTNGKDIYSRTLPPTTAQITNGTWGFGGLASTLFDSIDQIITASGITEIGTNNEHTCVCQAGKNLGFYSWSAMAIGTVITIEYTKTTD